MAAPTQRLIKRIERDFTPAHAREVIGWLTGLAPESYGRQDEGRVQAALVLRARGNLREFISLVELMRLDWRDLLMAGGLGNSDWPAILDAELSET
ncbi:hypothetical protein [Dactylosporangium matsuzakiense]|uniref:Uncharacterized protein n=1 Tax=Dactylosporangium matsuzakiense TaxID=53360 RepID=A0A9W6KK60_9ACTN|nr:hypothetical protein [Dactylosporangium matsuzakiense]UWZ41102.1 hypothetical protein Dmats_25650 [Dactylosporangium matsuzakiense]GLL00999.1 hypothetical protein GCM10017581_027400 [Dactylosporangium matsuzakiense]